MGAWSMAMLLVAPRAMAGVEPPSDPYGGTTTTTPGGDDDPTCQASIDSGVPGTRGSAHVEGVTSGATVRVLIGGTEAGAATATSTSVDVPFTVPDLGAGTFDIVASGPTFLVSCSSTGFVVGVLGGAQRPSDDDGPLPRTGTEIALLVFAALALLVVGYMIVQEARRRRRRAERAAMRSVHRRPA